MLLGAVLPCGGVDSGKWQEKSCTTREYDRHDIHIGCGKGRVNRAIAELALGNQIKRLFNQQLLRSIESGFSGEGPLAAAAKLTVGTRKTGQVTGAAPVSYCRQV